MRLFSKLFIGYLALIFLLACKNDNHRNFSVLVHYKNAMHPVIVSDLYSGQKMDKVSKVYLYEVPFGTDNPPVALDSGTIRSDVGDASLNGNGKEEGVYEVVFDNGHVVLISNDSKEVEIQIDFSKKDNYYDVTGSDASKQMKDFAITYTDYSQRVNRAFAEMDSLKQFNAKDSIIIGATETKNNEVKKLNTYLSNFIANTTHPALALYALGWASRSFGKEEFESALQTIVNKFPRHEGIGKLKKNYEKQQAQMAQMEKIAREREAKNKLWTGKIAPDLSLPDVNGKLVNLSSFRGKYVLVDFWASWCGPCRQENPNVVSAYNEFKDKNFTIVGVSLDKDRSNWIEAINADHLTWTHISDLKWWNSKAVLEYKFDGIPYNILINPEGKVIAESLRGDELKNKLKEVLP